MNEKMHQINNLDDLFDKWFSSFDDLFDDTKNRTREELIAKCRENAVIDMKLVEQLQYALQKDEKFNNKIRLIYKDLCENPEALVLFWTSYNIKIARKKNTLKRLFKEWFRLNYALKLYIGVWENKVSSLNGSLNTDELLGAEFNLNTAKRMNNHALKFINMLFEEYNIVNNKKFLNKDYKN